MFDAALIESASHPGYDRRARSLPLAIGFHAAVVGTLVLSALWSTGETAEPAIPVVFPSFSGGPPPPPPGGQVNLRLVRATLPPRARTERFPERMPEVLPVMPADVSVVGAGGPVDSPGDSSAEGGESSGGQSGGVPGGMPKTDGSDSRPGDLAPYTPGVGGVTMPRLVERVDPIYPEAARKGQIQGVVVLEAIITASGVVDEVRIVSSTSPLFEGAVAAAVRRWRYRPATLNGRAVPVLLTVTVRFGLNG